MYMGSGKGSTLYQTYSRMVISRHHAVMYEKEIFYLSTNIEISKRKSKMTQEELREIYKQRLEKEKQSYISKVLKIDPSILSKFKTGKFDLYPHLFEKLEAYLLNN